MNKVLIIGSEGGLGQAFAEVYKDLQPVCLTHADLDITKEQDVLKWFAAIQPNLVLNCAAYNSVDKAEEERAFAENVNGYAPGFLAHAASQIGATLVHYSTGQVFDGTKAEGYKEDEVTNPINAYGASKLLGEMELQKNTDKFYIIRTAWLYGKSKAGKKSFVDLMLEKAKAEEIIKVVEDEFGPPTYVFDLAQASRALIEEKKPFGIYHLTNTGSVSRYEWAKEIFRLKNMDKVKLVSMSADELQRAAKRPKYEVLVNTKFIQLRPWTEALQEFLKS